MDSWPLNIGEQGVRWQAPHEHQEWLWPRSGRTGRPLRSIGAGRYRLLGVLSQGGQAHIWAAHDAGDGSLVAVKIERPDGEEPSARARLAREARLLTLVGGSPFVMSLLAWSPGTPQDDVDAAAPWLILPYRPHIRYAGALAAQGGAFGPHAALGLAHDLAAGLLHLHARGVVHRDLSPNNVLLTGTGAVVTDLGMGWAPSVPDEGPQATSDTGLTQLYGRGVTHGWAAPETFNDDQSGHPDRQPAADVFGWGLHVATVTLGRHPWAREGLSPGTSQQRRMMFGEPSDLTGLAHRIGSGPAELVTAALAPNPAHRPSANDLLAQLTGAAPFAPGPGPSGPRVVTAPTGPVRPLQMPVVMGETGTGYWPPAQQEIQAPLAGAETQVRVEPGAPGPDTRPRRRWLAWTAAIATLVLAAGGITALVVLYRSSGIPDGGYQLTSSDGVIVAEDAHGSRTSSGLPIDLLPETDKQKLIDGITVSSSKERDARLEQLRTAARPKLGAVSIARGAYPKANTITVSWPEPDHRAGVTTVLTVSPSAAGCPGTVVKAGSCTIQAGWEKTYTATMQAVLDPIAAAADKLGVNAAPGSATTLSKPFLSVRPGAQFVTDTTYCQVQVTATGLEPSSPYRVTINDDLAVRDNNPDEGFAYSVDSDANGTINAVAPDGWGYGDPSATGWLEVTLGGMTKRADPWACP